jgi:hypothetical protein
VQPQNLGLCTTNRSACMFGKSQNSLFFFQSSTRHGNVCHVFFFYLNEKLTVDPIKKAYSLYENSVVLKASNI